MINQNKSDGKAASGKRNSKKRYTYRRPVKKGAPRQKKPEESVHIAFLGGMNEIGKNMTLYEYKDDMGQVLFFDSAAIVGDHQLAIEGGLGAG